MTVKIPDEMVDSIRRAGQQVIDSAITTALDRAGIPVGERTEALESGRVKGWCETETHPACNGRGYVVTRIDNRWHVQQCACLAVKIVQPIKVT